MSREEPMPMWGEHSMSMQEPGEMSMQAASLPAVPVPGASSRSRPGERAERLQQRLQRQLAVTRRSYLHQICPNASKLVGYAVQPDASLDEITSASIPYQSPQA